jgi:hypothetical protein
MNQTIASSTASTARPTNRRVAAARICRCGPATRARSALMGRPMAVAANPMTGNTRENNCSVERVLSQLNSGSEFGCRGTPTRRTRRPCRTGRSPRPDLRRAWPRRRPATPCAAFPEHRPVYGDDRGSRFGWTRQLAIRLRSSTYSNDTCDSRSRRTADAIGTFVRPWQTTPRMSAGARTSHPLTPLTNARDSLCARSYGAGKGTPKRWGSKRTAARSWSFGS